MTSSPDLEQLKRWTTAGGEWRVIARSATSVTVALLTCDEGEEMERIVSSDSAFATYVESRAVNES